MLSETCRKPFVQLVDARQHGVQGFRQAVELVAGAADRQALRAGRRP